MILHMDGVLLSLEISGICASVALWIDGKLIGEERWESDRHHSAHIFDPLGRLLNELHGVTPETILVGAGPGSYGGVRAALAVADGLALVYDAKVVSLCSWSALTLPYPEAWVISDARRNGWAIGHFIKGHQVGELLILDVSAMPEWLAGVQSSEVPILSVESAESLTNAGLIGVTGGLAPTAHLLGDAWIGMSNDEHATYLMREAAPIYVRPPHITAAKRPAWMIGGTV
ncbi:MAG: tRNA (adenosine(37)-N6)-threonylcarbamoyltransferase complex dimerization subunit type 1 TsaB [Akkermansia sp.]